MSLASVTAVDCTSKAAFEAFPFSKDVAAPFSCGQLLTIEDHFCHFPPRRSTLRNKMTVLVAMVACETTEKLRIDQFAFLLCSSNREVGT